MSELDLIDKINHQPTPELVLHSMMSAFQQFGISNIIVTNLDPTRKTGLTVLTGWPSDVLQAYVTRNCLQFSPVARHARNSFAPFLWNHQTWMHEPDRRAQDVMKLAAEFGIREGFMIPVRGPHGLEAGISLLATKIDLPQGKAPALHLVGMYSFMRLRQLLDRDTKPVAGLSPREKDVLTLSAYGNSAVEIADRLRITKGTVDKTVQNICRKMRVRNRTHAVAIAIRDRLIGL